MQNFPEGERVRVANAHQLLDAVRQAEEEWGSMAVYLPGGRRLGTVRVEVMRDAEGNTPFLALSEEVSDART